jgi:FkbM family methyltransferase
VRQLRAIAQRAAETLGRDSWIVHRLRPFYERVLSLAAARRGLPTSINGVPVRIDPRYRAILPETYEPDVAEFLQSRVKPGAVCLDVGANIGAYVLQFAHWSGPWGRVFAFEPNPTAVTILANHVRLNGLEGRVQIVEAAVGDKVGEATMFAAGSDGMSRLHAPNPLIAQRTSSLTVPVTTIDSFCRRHNVTPDWLLVDVEGLEMAVLRGAQATICRCTTRLGIVVEMHPSAWQLSDTSAIDVARVLDALELQVVPLTGQNDPFQEYGTVCLERRS